MRRILPLLTAVCVLLSLRPALAQDYAKPIERIDPKSGDTIMFLGDSITHQCLYTQYVEDYFITRYPATRLHFYNSGISGDVAADPLTWRFDGDVAAIKPTFVTVLLGMNDGRYEDFNPAHFATYRDHMTQLVDKLVDGGATVVLMKPTMHDIRAWRMRKPGEWRLPKDEPIAEAYNSVLGYYGAWVQRTAEDRGLGLVDLYAPLNELTFERRKTEPTFTMIPDSVHPNATGQAVMAFTMLQTLHPNRKVSSVVAALRGNGWQVRTDGSVDAIEGDATRLKFTHTATALPWVLPPEAAEGYAITKAGHKMSNERLTVVGLAPGRYRLTIDGVEVGVYPHTVLAAKVELQANDKTPQYQQAMAVAMINKDRNDKAVRPLRSLWGRLKGQRDKLNDAAWMETFNADVAKLRALADEYETKAYEAAQPKPHVYELTAVGGK